MPDDGPVMKKLSVVMPAFNEDRTIETSIQRIAELDLSALGLRLEIIVVDDGSTDRTNEIIRRLQERYPTILLISHEKNSGKGAAIKSAILRATGDILIVQDADLENDPNDIAACLRPIVEGRAGVVYGSRRLNKENKKRSRHSFFFLGGVAVTWTFNCLFLQHLTDEPTCYKTFRMDIIKSLKIEGNRFEWEPEVTAKLAKRGYRIFEVPISYFPRSVRDGKKLRWKDGIKAVWTIIRFRFRS